MQGPFSSVYPSSRPAAAGPLDGVSTAAACAQACCADASCEVWQFCAAGHCAGSAAPPNSCYTGMLGSCSAGPGWESRGLAQPPFTFHNATGHPVVNTTRFPDLRAMTDEIHALGLTAGWYGAGLLCLTRSWQVSRHLRSYPAPQATTASATITAARTCASRATSTRLVGGRAGGAREEVCPQARKRVPTPLPPCAQSASALTPSSTTGAPRSIT